MCIRKGHWWGTERCSKEYQNDTLPGYCPPVWDNYLCWPPTAPGNLSFLPCPRLRSNDVAKFAFRQCGENGTWTQRPGSNDEIPIGWTNYTGCFNPYVQELMAKVLQASKSNSTRNDFPLKHKIAEGTRTLEMVGLTLSIVSLVMSLIIFYRFRNLQNNRTRIHKNLFIAMSIQVVVRLIVYIDQYFGQIYNLEYYTIETTKYTCEAAYILLEYARTSMFLWMFVEGLYLHNMITVTVFQDRRSLTIYYTIGWGSPIFLVLIWGSLTYHAFYGYVCWSNYNLSGLFWVLEGPRLLVITLNFLFLLNIIRVLVTKLRKSNSTEAQQVRKAVKAAIVLLPLLGITNAIQMIHTPLDKNIIEFAIWSYLTMFLTSFQGFFCALIYCFLNEEVQVSVKRFYRARRNRIDINRKRSINPGGGAASVVQNLDQDSGSPITPAMQRNQAQIQATRQHACHQDSKSSKRRNDNKVCLERETVDPFFHQEDWSDGELSSHNHVDVEQIEIPLEYFTKTKQRKTNATVFGTVLSAPDDKTDFRIIQASINSVGANSTSSSTTQSKSGGNAETNDNGSIITRSPISNIFTKIDISSRSVLNNSSAIGEEQVEVNKVRQSPLGSDPDALL